MAVSQVKVSAYLVMKVKTGTDSKGNDVFKNMTLRNVKTSAADADVFEVATAIGTLLNNSVQTISRQDLSELVSQ